MLKSAKSLLSTHSSAIAGYGLYTGIFASEQGLQFLFCIENVAHDCLHTLKNSASRYVGSDTKIIRKGLRTVADWDAATRHQEAQKALSTYNQLDDLYKHVLMDYVNQMTRTNSNTNNATNGGSSHYNLKGGSDQTKRKRKIHLRIPAFVDFYSIFMRMLACGDVVQSMVYFEDAAVVERKIAIMDAIRKAFAECLQGRIEYKYDIDASSSSSSINNSTINGPSSYYSTVHSNNIRSTSSSSSQNNKYHYPPISTPVTDPLPARRYSGGEKPTSAKRRQNHDGGGSDRVMNSLNTSQLLSYAPNAGTSVNHLNYLPASALPRADRHPKTTTSLKDDSMNDYRQDTYRQSVCDTTYISQPSTPSPMMLRHDLQNHHPGTTKTESSITTLPTNNHHPHATSSVVISDDCGSKIKSPSWVSNSNIKTTSQSSSPPKQLPLSTLSQNRDPQSCTTTNSTDTKNTEVNSRNSPLLLQHSANTSHETTCTVDSKVQTSLVAEEMKSRTSPPAAPLSSVQRYPMIPRTHVPNNSSVNNATNTDPPSYHSNSLVSTSVENSHNSNEFVEQQDNSTTTTTPKSDNTENRAGDHLSEQQQQQQRQPHVQTSISPTSSAVSKNNNNEEAEFRVITVRKSRAASTSSAANTPQQSYRKSKGRPQKDLRGNNDAPRSREDIRFYQPQQNEDQDDDNADVSGQDDLSSSSEHENEDDDERNNTYLMNQRKNHTYMMPIQGTTIAQRSRRNKDTSIQSRQLLSQHKLTKK